MSHTIRISSLREHRWTASTLTLGALMAFLSVTPALADFELNEAPEMSAGAEAVVSAPIIVDPMSGRVVPPDTSPDAPPLNGFFDTIDFLGNAANTGFFQIPPDPHGAVGLNHAVSVVNSTIQWHTKAGVLQNNQRLGRNGAGSIVGSFFASLTPANTLFDPKVIYDQYSDRFVVVCLEQVGSPNTSRILVAASDDGDPNGAWCFQAINSLLVIGGVNTWADYPGLAIDTQAIYITTNQFRFTNVFAGNRVWILDKSILYACGISPVGVYDPAALAVGPGPFFSSTMMPTHMFGALPAGQGTHLVLYSGLSTAAGPGGTEAIQVITIINALGVIAFTGQFVGLGNIDIASGTLPRTPQMGTAIRIDTGDRRALACVWRSNNLYVVFHVNPEFGVNAGQCTTHWLRVDTTNPAAFDVLATGDQGDIGGEDLAAGASTSYPSIAVNRRGDVAVGFAASAPTTFQGAYYTGRLAGAAAGTMEPIGTLATGLDWYVRTFTAGSTGRNRWGDYTGTVVDPADDCTFWHFNEYAITQTPMGAGMGCTTVGGTTECGNHRERWGNWTFPGGCPPVAVELAYFAAERTDDGAILRWEVTDADNHAGFNVYRGAAGSGRTQLNGSLLSGQTRYEFRDDNAPPDGADYYLEEVSRDGFSSWYGPATLAPAAIRVPVFSLAPGKPNPFNQATRIAYSLAAGGPVRLSVFDPHGRKVASLVDGVEEAGDHSVEWNGRLESGQAAAAGFYVVSLEAGGKALTQKIVLAR